MPSRPTPTEQLAFWGVHLTEWPEETKGNHPTGDWIHKAEAYAQGIRLRRAQLRAAAALDRSSGELLLRVIQNAGDQSSWDRIVVRYLLSDLQEDSQYQRVQAAAKMVAKEGRTEAQLLGAALELVSRGHLISGVYGIKRLIAEYPMSDQECLAICAQLVGALQVKPISARLGGDDASGNWLQIVRIYSEATRMLGIASSTLSREEKRTRLVTQLEIFSTQVEEIMSFENSSESMAIALVTSRERRIQSRSKGKPLLRTIHHLACTGGTVISKCLAAMPQTALISEVNPFNRSGNSFEPTNPLLLLERSHRLLSTGEIMEDFTQQVSRAFSICQHDDVDLILRDHSHTDFCTGTQSSYICPIADFLSDDYELLSAVTVRHPLDSFLSMLSQGWEKQFAPSSLNEYSRRYLAFIERYSTLPIFRYEDFCVNPEHFMRELCATLEISFSTEFISRFGRVELSGDSGRKGTVSIEPRQRRKIPDSLRIEIECSERYAELLLRLGYCP